MNVIVFWMVLYKYLYFFFFFLSLYRVLHVVMWKTFCIQYGLLINEKNVAATN